MQTETRVQFALCDVTARGDCTPIPGEAQPFCHVAQDLAKDPQPGEWRKFGTLEPGQCLLDGTFALVPDDPQGETFGFWSRVQSGADGRFAAPPKLVLQFAAPHTSAGLTLYFYPPTGEWATEVQLRWFDAAGLCLATARCSPDAAVFFVPCTVEGYRRIELEFYATNYPGRCLKLAGIDYGARLSFTGSDLVQATLLEEVSPSAQELSVNTLDLVLHDRAGQFHVLQTGGYFDVLQQKMPFGVQVLAREDAPGAAWQCHEMGHFYLSEWANEGEGTVRFRAVDAIGLLDGMPWQAAMVDTTVAELAAELLRGIPYEVDPALAGLHVQGFLPGGSCRDALLQLAFAVGALVQSSRSAGVRLCSPSTGTNGSVGMRRRFTGGRIRLDPPVTALQLSASHYEPGKETETLYEGTLQAGEHSIEWQQPAVVQSIRVQGGTLLQAGVCGVRVRVAQTAAVQVTGCKYQSSTMMVQRTPADLPANAPTRVLKVSDAALVHPGNVDAVAKRLLAHYANRTTAEFRMVAVRECPGDLLQVEYANGAELYGMVQRMETDLTGGCVATVRLVGRRVRPVMQRYVGTAYAGESWQPL